MKHKTMSQIKRTAGFTLIEVLVVLAIAGVIIASGLSLSGIGTSSNEAMNLSSAINSIRTVTQSMYAGQGGYGTAAINGQLITAKKVPANLTFSGTTINTSNGGTITVTGNTSNVTIAVTNLSPEDCVAQVTRNTTGWSAVKVGTGTALATFPVTPAIASSAAQCGGTGPFTVSWTTDR